MDGVALIINVFVASGYVKPLRVTLWFPDSMVPVRFPDNKSVPWETLDKVKSIGKLVGYAEPLLPLIVTVILKGWPATG